ncbi:COX15/CtaA family protein [Aliifodinibius sp. S!AR15-10]|uniref:COX15/CtaA family protein n=1 Tax=Aliifodinibius sp. S!AR15-10 TaxID=2950437 RepID=UPI00285444FE|nr:COX15/CtaA family protein [Aliifodinibius sp. S!AR15-10]MDR8393207.1 COX15/CtaA family protein [Aliifodinibius sp. S!AR15-10]
MKFNTYQKTAITTVGATIFLIFVGGLVRAAGAGLGCPDWPKCFGMWIPPTSVAELPSQFDASQFNVFKTWTEYLNRLVGVVIGLLITATFLLSFQYRKKEPHVFYSSAAAFVLVLVQGWLGGQVVMTGLDEWLISLHMVLAMIIMTVLLYAVFKATSTDLKIKVKPKIQKILFWSGLGLLVLTMVQLVLGTQVREAIDIIKNSVNPPPRQLWIQQVGFTDEIHRSFSWALFILGGVVLYFSKWRSESKLVNKLGLSIFGLILFQILVGTGLYYLGMPPVYQVFHLVGVAFLICAEVLFLLVLWKGMRDIRQI